MLLRLAPFPRGAARLAAAALVLAAAACKRSGAGVDTRFALQGTPGYNKPSVVAVTAPPGAEAVFTADMSHPGMDPLVAKASETAPGRYEASLTWTMSGEWTVFFDARWDDGRRAERQDRVSVP
ncbi:MAG: FixH family protein [Elusimicrobia bacterium]|nr:FixH family protein [Elusimicrobiota bacterium]